MQIETKDLKAITKKFFAVYGAHDVEAMTALCADDAKGRYAPYDREYVVPVRGGLNAFWKGFTQAVPDFHVEVVETRQAEGNAIVVQAVLGGTISADAPGGIAKTEGDYVIVHGRFSGHGPPVAWIAADIVRIENGRLAEHWDVLQDEATKAESKSGLPMFGDRFAA